jgi:hypothetical protein
MNYVCIEEDKIIGIFNYQPEVPESVQVIEITDEEYKLINEKTHFLDSDGVVKPRPQEDIVTEEEVNLLQTKNAENREYLESTDWMILRHLRQQALGVETSLTQDEYIDLEQKRQTAAESIKSV